MKRQLWGMYHYSKCPITGETTSADMAYYFLYLWEDEAEAENEAIIPTSILESVYHQLFPRQKKTPHRMGPFFELATLRQFALQVARRLDIPQVALLAAQDFNSSYQKSSSLDELKAHLLTSAKISDTPLVPSAKNAKRQKRLRLRLRLRPQLRRQRRKRLWDRFFSSRPPDANS